MGEEYGGFCGLGDVRLGGWEFSQCCGTFDFLKVVRAPKSDTTKQGASVPRLL